MNPKHKGLGPEHQPHWEALLFGRKHSDANLRAQHPYPWASRSASGKELDCQCRRRKRHGFNPCVGTIPWRRAWQPTPVLLPGESQGQRSLEGDSPRGHKESDMTEHTAHDTGEDNPLGLALQTFKTFY